MTHTFGIMISAVTSFLGLWPSGVHYDLWLLAYANIEDLGLTYCMITEWVPVGVDCLVIMVGFSEEGDCGSLFHVMNDKWISRNGIHVHCC